MMPREPASSQLGPHSSAPRYCLQDHYAGGTLSRAFAIRPAPARELTGTTTPTTAAAVRSAAARTRQTPVKSRSRVRKGPKLAPKNSAKLFTETAAPRASSAKDKSSATRLGATVAIPATKNTLHAMRNATDEVMASTIKPIAEAVNPPTTRVLGLHRTANRLTKGATSMPGSPTIRTRSTSLSRRP